ncbi:ABC transporter permease [Candidatus Allofournierella excrementavium]|uniref:ABC transporter permease n=1 Tax=Candidatus Allofournierella excrementavium TaxID=2838591 RepID=UPI00374F22E7
MFQSFLMLWKHRKMLRATTISDIRSKYAGSVLGMFWLILYPVLMLTAYSIVYVFILRLRLDQISTPEYVMLIFAGLIPFLGFSEGLASSVVSVTANSSLVKNTLYPIEIIPVKAVFCSQCTEVVGMALLVIALAIAGNLSWWALLVIVIWFFQVMFGIGVGWIISALNVVLRDMQSLIGIMTMFLMMVSPIAYTPDMIPDGLRPLLKLNPLYYFITAYQDCLLYQRYPMQNVLPILVIFSIATFLIGYWFFEKMKQLFDDNI